MRTENKLIAEFMGVVFHDDENQYYNADGLHIGLDLKYHTSWDWLMPVLIKCMQTGDDTDKWDHLYNVLSELNVDKLYKAVVEFIKYINQLNN
jgi:hypothetical protein